MLRLALACLFTIAAGGAYLSFAAGPAPQRVLAETRFDYHEEHGTDRVVAEVNATLRTRGDGVELAFSTSALGSHVEPLPGFEHVRGANMQTAFELEVLLAESALGIETRSTGADAAVFEGDVLPAELGTLPQRRMRADGSVDYDARSPRVPFIVRFVTGALPAGEWRSEVRVHGRVRLAIDFAFQDGVGEIRRVRDHFPRAGETHP